jgi:hypothetical protein
MNTADIHRQGTALVMALIGMAVYSTTYALLYAATANATVPVLEMWMATTHVACAALALATHARQTTSSVFLGVACGITILGNDCIQYGNCALYFGAATLPRIAAAGAMAWAWVMYVVSFDGVPDTFVAALVMAMVPIAVEAKTLAACGDKWQLPLGAQNGMIWARLAVASALLLLALFFKRWVLVLQPLVLLLMQPRGARVSASPLPYYITTCALAAVAVLLPLLKAHHRYVPLKSVRP